MRKGKTKFVYMDVQEAINRQIAQELQLNTKHVSNCCRLLEEGATVPFIARYRKEMTGSMEDVSVLAVSEALKRYRKLEERRQTILSTIAEQGNLTPELEARIQSSWDSTELEDIYLPFKPRRKTRAYKAREAGLTPLAAWLMKQQDGDVEGYAQRFVRGELADVKEALQGARYIMAEWISERPGTRNQVRRTFAREALITSKVVKGKEEEGAKYRDYFKYEGPLRKCPSHRFLALLRAEDEGIIKLDVAPPEERVLPNMESYYVKSHGEAGAQMQLAAKDAWKRLLKPSISNEFRKLSKEQADQEAIRVFAANLRQLLLAPPLGGKRILAIDPGFRTGCKLVCLTEQGSLRHNETIYPHPPQRKDKEAMRKISQLIDAYKIEAIAIGNGTAGRETENLIKRMRFRHEVQVFSVNEDGASVYSASSVGREEFPDYDVTVRGAVSIGRRLMDPLAEMVKIDPKSLGVGQYQHDVDQTALKEKLDAVVESVVNQVGVDLNTASHHLLSYVSGIGPKLAKNIVSWREESGSFESRKQLLKVSGLGAKSFEQCSGFLRIPNAKNPLDNSAVHPERYKLVEKMAKDQNCSVADLIGVSNVRANVKPESYVNEEVGLPTLQDILTELEKPGRDPRSAVKVFEFDANLRSIDDVQPGMEIPGVVANITNFGAFVDIGVKESGLIHLSEMADRFIKDPHEIVHLNQQLIVRVKDVDRDRKRIQLSLKGITAG